VVRKHIEQRRQATFERSITIGDLDMARASLSAQGNGVPAVLTRQLSHIPLHRKHRRQPIRDTIHTLAVGHRPRLLIMREEKDRFDAMRAIQYDTMRFRRWNDLFISIIAFAIVWTGGAVVFWRLEEISYFDGLYFCFCSLLTIGYGDVTPQSNAGRPFFVMWSLIAIPTMTMLISQMSDTVVAAYKKSTEKLGDYTLMPRSGAYRSCLNHFPFIMNFIQKRQEKKRLKRGFPVGADADPDQIEDRPSTARTEKDVEGAPNDRRSQDRPHRTIEELASEPNPSPFELAQQLAFAIRRTSEDARVGKRKRYSYEEWVEYTRLIQFTDPRSGPSSAGSQQQHRGVSVDKDEYGVLNWDWIGESSPMLAHQTEPEWVLDRLCESLVRYVSTQEQARAESQGQGDDAAEAPTLKKEQDLGLEQN
jgi:potassium channel subfamily K